MSAIGDLVATLGMDTKPWGSAIGGAQSMLKKLEASTAATVAKVGGAFSSIAKLAGAGALVGGGMSIGQNIAGSIGSWIGEAKSAQREQKRLDVILQSSGASASVSADKINEFAEAQAKLTNFDDDSTRTAAAAMAPFADRMGGSFLQVLKSAQDVTAVMGGDLTGNARTLALAMADPVRGMRALRQMGILFSDTQKEQIKNFVEQGNLAGAQQTILSQLTAKFGGDAEKMASPMAILQNELSDIGKQIGAELLPAAKWFTGALVSGIRQIISFGAQLKETFGGVWESIKSIAAAIFDNPIAKFAIVAIPLVIGVGSAFMMLMPIIASVGATIGTIFTVATGPIGLVIAAVAAIGYGLVSVLGTGDTFGAKLTSIMDGLGVVFRNFSLIAQRVPLDIVISFLEAFPGLQGPITGIAAFFIGAFTAIGTFIKIEITNMIAGFQALYYASSSVFKGIVAAIKQLKKGNFSDMGAAFSEAFSEEFQKVQALAKNVKNPYTESYRAGMQASSDFQNRMASGGGLTKTLQTQRAQIQKQIDANERAYAASKVKKEAEAAKPPAVVAAPIAQAVRATTMEDLPKIVEKGSSEEWKTLLAAQFGTRDNKDKHIAATATATQKTADILDRMENRGDEPDWEIG